MAPSGSHRIGPSVQKKMIPQIWKEDILIREEPPPVTSVINKKWKEILSTEGKILRRVSENFEV
jgi:hypothetical protein